MKDFVIFSAIIGNYDTIHQPIVVDERFDYILFSNNIFDSNIGIWQIRPIPFDHTDPTRIARYVKTHPEELLPMHRYSIWMDASIQINDSGFYDKAISIIQSNCPISVNGHPYRNCIYDEMFTIMQQSLEYEPVVIKWGQFLRKEKYPRNHGLSETNILLRQHHNASVIALNKLWWDCISQYSRRDQLSFNYVLWKLDINIHIFYTDLRKSSSISYFSHDNSSNRKKIGDPSPLMRQCQQWPTNNFRNIKKIYYLSYLFPNPYIILGIGYYSRKIYLWITKGDIKYKQK